VCGVRDTKLDGRLDSFCLKLCDGCFPHNMDKKVQVSSECWIILPTPQMKATYLKFNPSEYEDGDGCSYHYAAYYNDSCYQMLLSIGIVAIWRITRVRAG
jgi:hypothetical protein